MEKIKGITASRGIAKGTVHIEKLQDFNNIEEKKIDESEVVKAVEKLDEAVEKAKKELQEIKEKTEKEVGKEEAELFSAHIMFLDDPEFTGTMRNKIKENNFAAKTAVIKVMDKYVSMFEKMDNEYMKARKTDIEDVSRRLIDKLEGKKDRVSNFSDNTVVIAKDLTPSMTARLNKDKTAAFVTAVGSRTSHTAIMSRSLGIPAIVGAGEEILEAVKEGDKVIVDGNNGELIVKPDQKTLKDYDNKIEEYKEKLALLEKYKGKKAKTNDGEEIEVAGNIGNIADVEGVLENGGEGIGLFRTEFLYMDRKSLPDEDEQFEVYKDVAEKMGDKPVIVRTLDVGGDKDIPYLDLAEEMNPFLGYRAIRLCLDRKEDIFKPQLKAILRASNYGNIKMMYPFVSSYEEVIEANKVLSEVKKELDEKDIGYDELMEVGIMIETPAAVMIAEKLAKEVDFFSIGTNDLIQYTTAVDRTNEKISGLHNPYHPGVLKLIKKTIDKAHENDIWVGMCGAAAGNPLLLPYFLGAGLDEFSMSPSSIPELKKKLENWTREKAKRVVAKALDMNTSKEVKNYFEKL
ncbi:MAG: phosphoenolpyruvate--protein phosphotransferase [Bacillota bacterium]